MPRFGGTGEFGRALRFLFSQHVLERLLLFEWQRIKPHSHFSEAALERVRHVAQGLPKRSRVISGARQSCGAEIEGCAVSKRECSLQALTTMPQPGNPNVVLHFYDSAF
jgi:hypothetical protein